MWEVRDKLDDEVPLDNDNAELTLYIYRKNKLDSPRTLYRIQEDSFENDDFSTIWLRREMSISALTIRCKGNCSAILKVYGGMEILAESRLIKKWYLLYKKMGDVSNNSTLCLVNPDMNCEKMIRKIQVHYDNRNIMNLLTDPVINVFGFKTIELQTVHNNKRLKLSSETEQFATESENEKKFDYFSILPNEIIVKIFEYFDLKSLARTAQVCSRFNRIVTKTDHFYYNLDFWPYWNVFSVAVFDKFMKKTKKLKKLNLSWCNQDRDKFYHPKLKKFLNGAKNTLTHLYIDEQRYVLIYSVIKAIFACQELLELHLRNTQLIFCHLKWFNADIIQFKNLRKLDFSHSHIEDAELITILSKTRKLKHLILDFVNNFSLNMDIILEKIVEFDINLETWSAQDSRLRSISLPLFQFQTNLEELDLSYSFLIIFPPTFNFLAECSRLKRLGLAKCSDIIDEQLVSVTENCKKLEEVNFSSLKLITAKIIREFLELENLKVLNITNCTHETISLSQIKEWQNEYPHVQIWSNLE